MTHHRFTSALLTSAALLAGPSMSAQAAQYACVKVGKVGNMFPEPQAINNLGHIAGTNDFGDGRAAVAAVWKSGKVLDLGKWLPPDAESSWAHGLNDQGQAIGRMRLNCGQFCRQELPVMWQGDTPTALPLLPDTYEGYGWAINNKARAVGNIEMPSGASHAVLWRDGKVKDLGALGTDPANTYSHAYGIGDNNTVVGSSARGPGIYYEFAVSWDAKGTATDLGGLPQATWSDAWDVNKSGVIVGRSDDPAHDTAPVVWQGGKVTKLGMPSPNAIGMARAINDSNVIVGWQSDGGELKALLWASPSAAPQRLDDLVDANGCQANGLKFWLTNAHAINEAGQIAAYGQATGGKFAIFRLTPH